MMNKTFSYTRPALLYVGYTISIIMFLIPLQMILEVIFKEGVLDFKLILGFSSFLIYFLLLDIVVLRKYQVELTENEIRILSFLGTKEIKYNQLTDVSLNQGGIGLHLIIKYQTNSNRIKKTGISNLRIRNSDLKKIQHYLLEKIE